MFSHRFSWRMTVALAALLTFALLGVGLWFARVDATPAPKPEPKPKREQTACVLPAPARDAPHPGMAWVPGGSFEFGDTTYPEELPIRKTSVTGFWMDRTEVTNDEFAAFIKATGYITVAERAVDQKSHPDLPPDMQKPGAVVFVIPKDAGGDIGQWWRYVPGANWRHPGGPDTSIDGRGSFPVVTVTFDDAQAYAKWKGHILPGEAQWEWAAQGGAGQAKAAQDHQQPLQANTWQGLFPMVNSGDDGFVGLAPVGCYAPNALGLFDMIGNVWELTADAYTSSHAQASAVPPDQLPLRPGGAPGRVIKGGSFLCAPNYCMRYRSGSRQPQEEDLGASHLGFRTILQAPGA